MKSQSRVNRSQIRINRSQIRIFLHAVVIVLAISAAAGVHAAPPTHANLAYGPHVRHKLDLYLPGGAGAKPLVVFIHGGGWLSGGKSHVSPYVDSLMLRGFAVASINYRLSFQAKFPAQLHDCKGAIRWLRAHASSYGIDGERLAVLGQSAGGHLAALVGTTSGMGTLEGSVGGNGAYSSRVQAVVDVNGPVDLFQYAQQHNSGSAEESQLIGHSILDIIDHMDAPSYAPWVNLVKSADPSTHASSADPPIFILHGSSDSVVPLAHSQKLNTALNNKNVRVQLHVVNGGGHDLPLTAYQAAFDFLQNELAPTAISDIRRGAARGDGHGWSVSVAGDVNGDGRDDAIVGTPFHDKNGRNAGAVYIYSGATNRVIRKLYGEAAGDHFGWSVAGLGDVNGDGRSDFAVGTPLNNHNGSDAGRVYVYSGKTGKLLRTFTGQNAGDRFGHSVAAVGDVNNDGRGDLAVGAPYCDSKGKNAGRAYLFSGRNGKRLAQWNGEAAGDRFGSSIAFAGSISSGGIPGIIVGAPGNDSNGKNAGRAYVYGRAGASWNKRLTVTGLTGDAFGHSVGSAGDLDGDGRDDLLVGAPLSDVGGKDSGRVYLLSGRDGSTIAIINAPEFQAKQRFGHAVGHAGDVNGDGLADFLIAAPLRRVDGSIRGKVYIFSGANMSVMKHFGSPTADPWFGYSLAGGGDHDGDGLTDVVVGAPHARSNGKKVGRSYVLSINDLP